VPEFRKYLVFLWLHKVPWFWEAGTAPDCATDPVVELQQRFIRPPVLALMTLPQFLPSQDLNILLYPCLLSYSGELTCNDNA